MGRAGAAKTHHRVGARVLAFFHQVHACGPGHGLDHHLMDAPGRFFHAELERFGDRIGYGVARGLHVQRHAPAQEEARVVVTEHQVGIGHGGLCSAHAVTGRARVGTGRVGSDLEQAHFVDAGNGTATGADFYHLDHG